MKASFSTDAKCNDLSDLLEVANSIGGSNNAYKIREATIADAPTIAQHRAAMFKDMGLYEDCTLRYHESQMTPYTELALAREQYHAWLVEFGNEIVSGAGLSIRHYFPRPTHPLGVTEAYVLNVYTAREHRRRGLAKSLILTIIEWCQCHEIDRISLHASAEGRMVYESLGFKSTNEMRFEL